MKRLTLAQSIGVATVFVAAACADPTSPGRSLGLEPPSLAVTTEYVQNGTPLPSTVNWGDVWLCKTVPAADPGGTFTFTVTAFGLVGNAAGPVLQAAPSLTVPAGGRSCELVFVTQQGIAGLDRVVIVEDAPPADWAVTGIDIRQIHWSPNDVLPDSAKADNHQAPPGRSATLYINREAVREITFTNDYTAPPPPPTGNRGCTPGYWKQTQHFDSWPAAYTQTTGFNATFGIGTAWFPNTFTLLQALGANGGGKNALARHATAALLNSGSGFYPLTTAQVIAAVQAAYANTSLIESKKDLLGVYNELGCPLN